MIGNAINSWNSQVVPGSQEIIYWDHSSKRVVLKGTQNNYEFSDAKTCLTFLVTARGLKVTSSVDSWSLTRCRDRLGIPRANDKPSKPPATIITVTKPFGKKAKASQQVQKAQALAPASREQDGSDLIEWVWQIRSNIEKATEAGSRTKRTASTRMIQAGFKLLKAGCGLHEVKQRLVTGWSKDEQQKFIGEYIGAHKFGSIMSEGKLLFGAGFTNIFFSGPPGCGKTELTKRLAEDMNLKFAAIPCFDDMPSSHIFGRMVADGTYIPVAFIEIFENGGVILLDEIFKLSPAVSVAMNMALANGWFYNPSAKKEMKRHDKCFIVGASNSFGLGSLKYVTDQPQDPAFLDRFLGAAVEVSYDTSYEISLIESSL